MLDLSFDLGKNIVGDALHLAIRVDTDKIPGALLRAYTQIEIEARACLNPSGIATKAQRQEAKEAAKLRASAEAADGRFRRLNHYPILWDGLTNTLYAGSTSTNVLDRLQSLFRETFARISSRSRPVVWRVDSWPATQATPNPSRSSWETSPSPWLPATLARPRAWPGPVTTPPAWTISATSFWSGSGTPFKTRAMPSRFLTARTSRSCLPRP